MDLQGGRGAVLANGLSLSLYCLHKSSWVKSWFNVQLSLLCRTHLPSVLTQMDQVHRERGFVGGTWPAAARLQAQPACTRDFQ